MRDDIRRLLDPSELRRNLVAASLYIMGFEMLKHEIADNLHDFFAVDGTADGWLDSDEYRREVLALDSNPVMASLLWFK
jgi:hypothetical protein